MKPRITPMRNVAVLVGSLMLVAAGCRQNVDPDSRQARLAVATNAELQEQVARYEAEMDDLKADCAEQLAAKDAELAASRKLVEDLRKEVSAGIESRVNSVMTKIIDDNARLRRENEALRAEITALRAEQ